MSVSQYVYNCLIDNEKSVDQTSPKNYVLNIDIDHD